MREDLSKLSREEIVERFKSSIEKGASKKIYYCKKILLRSGLDLESPDFLDLDPSPIDILTRSIRKQLEEEFVSFCTFDPRGYAGGGNVEGIANLCAHYGVDFSGFFVVESQSHNRLNNSARWLEGDFAYDKLDKPDVISTVRGEDFDKFMKDIVVKLKIAIFEDKSSKE